MFKNFLLLAYRNFIKSPLTSFIELFGMTLGLTVFLLILLWVFNETNYDTFNEHANQIYRLEVSADNEENSALNATMVAPVLKENLPEVKEVVRFRDMAPYGRVFILDDQKAKVEFDAGRIIYTDNAFFKTFSLEFIVGDPETALTRKNTTVITESLANTIFRDKNAIGEVLNSPNGNLFTITGIIKDVPNFHISFKMLRSFVSLEETYLNIGLKGLDTWGFPLHPTYLKVNKGQDIVQLEKKITSIIKQHRPEEFNKNKSNQKFHLRPLKDIYFTGQEAKEMGYAKHGDRKKVLAYISIALFTLLLACINFINLNNARSLERAREVGIKKVSGATRASIFIQFFGEVAILCAIALGLALMFTLILLPFFNTLMDSNLFIGLLLNPKVFAYIILGLVFISLLSGGIPALYISSFQPVKVMKGLSVGNPRKISFKKINLVLQFAVTIILLIGSITIYNQIHYMKNADLGFDKDQMIVFPINVENFGDKVDVMKRILLSNPNVHNVSHTHAAPGRNFIADQAAQLITHNGEDYQLTFAFVDEDYQKTLGLEMVEGRFFEIGRANDEGFLISKNKKNPDILNIVLNQTAVKTLGLKQPIGVVLKSSFVLGKKVKVIGVVKDFHLNSLQNKILPMYFICVDVRYQMIANIASKDMASTLKFINTEVEKITGNTPDVAFIDDEFNKQYGNDESFAKLIKYFTILAILIACMGLFGVAIYTIKLRLKEIGIRKTLGASSWVILKLITLYFLKLLLLSILIAVPIAWFSMDSWLSNYAYSIDLTSGVFIIGCVFTIVIAMLTIIWKSWQASNINPVKLIKYE